MPRTPSSDDHGFGLVLVQRQVELADAAPLSWVMISSAARELAPATVWWAERPGLLSTLHSLRWFGFFFLFCLFPFSRHPAVWVGVSVSVRSGPARSGPRPVSVSVRVRILDPTVGEFGAGTGQGRVERHLHNWYSGREPGRQPRGTETCNRISTQYAGLGTEDGVHTGGGVTWAANSLMVRPLGGLGGSITNADCCRMHKLGPGRPSNRFTAAARALVRSLPCLPRPAPCHGCRSVVGGCVGVLPDARVEGRLAVSETLKMWTASRGVRGKGACLLMLDVADSVLRWWMGLGAMGAMGLIGAIGPLRFSIFGRANGTLV